MIIFQLETQLEIYRTAYNGKTNLDEEIKINETKLDQLKEKFLNEIETLETEIEDIEGKFKEENCNFDLEKENLYRKYEENKIKIEEEYLKKFLLNFLVAFFI